VLDVARGTKVSRSATVRRNTERRPTPDREEQGDGLVAHASACLIDTRVDALEIGHLRRKAVALDFLLDFFFHMLYPTRGGL
jgi:hypothetical protein